MQPTMRQLEVFLAVARAGSFRRAAERIHVSQPAMSQHVGELERALGARLFDRRGRQVSLTEAGQILEDHALRVFATLASAQEAVAELAGGTRGALVVGASTTPGIYLLPALIGNFERDQPGISVTLRIANSRVIEEHIRANELDLGVVGGHSLKPGEECLAAGILDELVLIVSPGHPWAKRARCEPSMLTRERLLVREEGSATREVTERALQRADVKLGPTMVLNHTEAIKQAVMAGLGVAFVSIYAVRGELEAGRLASVRLRGLKPQRHFHVIHNEARTLTAGARAFVAALEAYGGPMGVPRRRKEEWPDGLRIRDRASSMTSRRGAPARPTSRARAPRA